MKCLLLKAGLWLGLMGMVGSVSAANTNDFARFDEAIRANPKEATNYLARGNAYFFAQNFDKAIDDFLQAIRLNPKDASAHEGVGVAYVMNSDFDLAISHFSRGLQLAPTNANIYYNRGAAHRLKKEFDEALRDFTQCLRLNPTNDLAYKARAAVYDSKEQYAKALADWNEGLRLNPKDAHALAARAHHYSKTGQPAKTIADLDEAIRLDPNFAVALNDLAWLRATYPVTEIRAGRAAIEAATKACELTQWLNAAYLDALAAAYAEAGDFKQAVEYQKKAVAGAISEDRAEMKDRLVLYEAQKPYRQPLPQPAKE